MKHCGGVLHDTERLAHFDRKATHEAGVLVMDEYFGESYMFEDVFQVEFGNPFCCY